MAKPVTYLVNLSEKDYVRKKNEWLPQIVLFLAAVTHTYFPQAPPNQSVDRCQ
jgi:hypothetical protein